MIENDSLEEQIKKLEIENRVLKELLRRFYRETNEHLDLIYQ